MKAGWASFQVHHPGPVLRKWMAALTQAGSGPALSRGKSRREQLGCTWMSGTSNTLQHGTLSTWWPLTEASSAKEFCGWLFQVGSDS